MEKKKKRLVIRTIILAVLVLAIGYTVYGTATKDKVELLAVGSKAPDFTLVDLNGEKHKLSDYKGQGVFLNFWGTWCKPCEKEMPAMDRQYKVFKDQGVQTLAVNIAQTDFEVQSFVDRYELTFPVVIDKTKSVMTTYNVGNLPATLLIDPDGKVAKIITGEMTEGKIASYMELVKPK
ncbi:thiol-disulfide oxidoreductase ResA [Lysinibacillus xylanilyticus]|uniref:thiol-disulfide oxidoreductase ResA n=1 Tax=Lysinibacillus xylanilyticus TaxID=582475 RepID=UPI002B24552B|nr:thiol-disulfide oxidoreductase ResA [Lysinibacillus xylanilyticus]MEB2302276.1 thiol-disulfide oxidoreductase ResA [Lysinibacillus xylanilyticus]